MSPATTPCAATSVATPGFALVIAVMFFATLYPEAMLTVVPFANVIAIKISFQT
jgi:hypothetical protein